MKPVLLAGATPLVTALGVRLARVNWPLAGVWDPDHERALTASLRVGCCAFTAPEEPLARAGIVLLGSPRPAWLREREGLLIVATWPEGDTWLEPLRPVADPGEDLLGTSFRSAGLREHAFVEQMGLTDHGFGIMELPPK